MSDSHRSSKKKLTQRFSNHLNAFRHSLAYFDALPQLTLLGLLIGAFTGAIIVVFRFLIDTPLRLMISGHSDNFESLAVTAFSSFLPVFF